MAKYSVPSIKFTEIDDTIRTSAVAGLGTGAIVMKSNKGPVNQRVMTSSYDEFTTIFGQPEELNDYGHFAAENYFNNADQLFAIRATMGDEQYAQIQYPYTDSTDKQKADGVASFEYINNEDANNLDLLQPLSNVTELSALTANGEYDVETGKPVFAAKQKAQFVTIQDLISDEAPAVAVFKTGNGATTMSDIPSGISAGSGKYVEFASEVSEEGKVISKYDDLIIDIDAWTATVPGSAFTVYPTVYTTGTASGQKVQFVVPASATVNGVNVPVTCWLNKGYVDTLTSSASTGTKYSTLFDNSKFYKGSETATSGYCDNSDAVKLQFVDWDDYETKTHYVKAADISGCVDQAIAISFREFGMADKTEALVNGTSNAAYAMTVKKISELNVEKAKTIAEEYGTDFSLINNDKYSLLTYCSVWDGIANVPAEQAKHADDIKIEKLIYTDSYNENDPSCKNEYLFWVTAKKDDTKTTSVSTYTIKNPSPVIVPWQDNTPDLNKIIAMPTSEVLNTIDGRYKDGFTLKMESEEEPGNGDIESYVSVKKNQLIIGAIGPGKFGNDIGVSIITPECESIPALNHQNAFNWKYRYDDEDLVDKNGDDLTWKKVYRINVYTKTKTQTAESAWGSGLDALVKDPIEYFYVSNDPQAKDGEGNSLYAPNVINGHSEYIYVSRSSVGDAMTGAGNFAMPEQTYAIYGLTGGANSKKNNITEKTAALKLYADRQKANFDILFNVEAIDTFNGKQRYATMQRRIAEIAAARTMDIGVVQTTSKEAKTIKRMLSEGKAFTFNDGSYVAPYANYDKYFNTTLASNIFLPKSVAGACIIARCASRFYPWMAPAGTRRGQITYTTKQLAQLSDDELGQLYDNNINYSRMCGNYGEVLWGQKTALKKDSAFNRINVRCCLNYIEKELENMLTPYMFEQQTANTRAAAKNSIDSFLNRVKAAEGVKEFATSVTEDPQDPHIMNVAIKLVPAEAIEYIDIKITVTRTSINTTETVG